MKISSTGYPIKERKTYSLRELLITTLAEQWQETKQRKKFYCDGNYHTGIKLNHGWNNACNNNGINFVRNGMFSYPKYDVITLNIIAWI